MRKSKGFRVQGTVLSVQCSGKMRAVLSFWHTSLVSQSASLSIKGILPMVCLSLPLPSPRSPFSLIPSPRSLTPFPSVEIYLQRGGYARI